MSSINSRNRLICRYLSYRVLTIFPLSVITPRSTIKGTFVPSSIIYFFLRLCSRFCGPAQTIFLVLMVNFPFLLARTVTISSCVLICACLKSFMIHPAADCAASSAVKFSWKTCLSVYLDTWKYRISLITTGRILIFKNSPPPLAPLITMSTKSDVSTRFNNSSIWFI